MISFWENVALTSESLIEADAAQRYLKEVHGVTITRRDDSRSRTHDARGYAMGCRCGTCAYGERVNPLGDRRQVG